MFMNLRKVPRASSISTRWGALRVPGNARVVSTDSTLNKCVSSSTEIDSSKLHAD